MGKVVEDADSKQFTSPPPPSSPNVWSLDMGGGKSFIYGRMFTSQPGYSFWFKTDLEYLFRIKSLKKIKPWN